MSAEYLVIIKAQVVSAEDTHGLLATANLSEESGQRLIDSLLDESYLRDRVLTLIFVFRSFPPRKSGALLQVMPNRWPHFLTVFSFPLLFPFPFAIFLPFPSPPSMLSRHFFSTVSNPSFRRDNSMTSSTAMVLRPACL